MDPLVYQAFVDEIKTASLLDDAWSATKGAVTGAKKHIGAATEAGKQRLRHAGRRVRRAPSGAAEGALRSAGHAAGEGLKEHATEIGDRMGKGIARHGSGVGRSMGEGIAEYGGMAVRRAVGELKRHAQKVTSNPKVRAGAAVAGAGTVALIGRGIYKQHKRDQTQDRIADALETISKREK